MASEPARGPAGLASLLGAWSFTRWIEDRRAGQGIDASGRVEIAATPQGATYDETAEMRLPGQTPLQATRRYLLEARAGQLHFLFDDGRFFHALDLAEATPRCHHDCPPDSYDVTYDFTGWPVWRATWSVTGPRKNYTMTTTYRPAAPHR
jgi:hypothetical protein